MSIDTVYQENRALEAEIEHLQARVEGCDLIHNEANLANSKLARRVEELEQLVAISEQEFWKDRDGHHFTDEQIDAAVEQINNWKTEDSVYTDYESGWEVLNKLNIKRCEGCGGGEGDADDRRWARVADPCPDCAKYGSHGWVKEESDG